MKGKILVLSMLLASQAQAQTFRTETGVTARSSTQSTARSEVYGTGTGGMSRNDLSAQGGAGGTGVGLGGAGGIGIGGAGGTGVGYGTAGVVDSGNSQAGVVDSGNSQAGVGQSGNSMQGQQLTFAPEYNTKGSDLGDVTPNTYAPPVSAGSNPCAVGFSGGLSLSGFGASAGGVYIDPECSLREWYRLLNEKLGTSVGAAMIRKNALCRSAEMWDVMELTAMEMKDPEFACKNVRPQMQYVELRPIGDLPQSFEIESRKQHPDPQKYSSRKVKYSTNGRQSGFSGENDGKAVGGGGFVH